MTTATLTKVDTDETFWAIIAASYGEQFAREEKDTNDR